MAGTGEAIQDGRTARQFRAGVDVIRLDVTVLDELRRPVRGLREQDFTILEDGKPQPIVGVEEVFLPEPAEPPAAWLRDVAPDVRTNDIRPDGRLVVILLDDSDDFDWNVNTFAITSTRAIGRLIVDRLAPDDLAAVVFTTDSRKAQDFTTDRARLLAAVDRFNPSFAPPRAATNTLRMVAEAMLRIPFRRKAVIYVGRGTIDFEQVGKVIAIGDGASMAPADDMRDTVAALSDAFGAALMSNTTFYAVDPFGLDLDSTAQAEALQTLAENGGGFAVVNTNEFGPGVERIFQESGSYYLVGYAPTNLAADGRYRRIDVRVNRPGVTVRARKGYVASKPGGDDDDRRREPASVQLASAISGFLPVGDLPMEVNVVPFAVPGKREAALAVVARVRQPSATARVEHSVELLTQAFEPDGRSRGSRRQTARVSLLPNYADVSEYEVLSRIDLRPGRYSLRVAALNRTIEKSGSVFYDVEVPDFSKDGIWLSGVVINLRPGVFAAPRDALSPLLPVLPTAARSFEPDDRVVAFARVYQGGKRAVAPVSVRRRIVDDTDRVVFTASQTLDAHEFGSDRAADVTFSVPLEQLAPGVFLLTLELAAGETVVARRDVRFVVAGRAGGRRP